MKKILLSTILILALAATGYAIPVKTAETGAVPQRTHSTAQDLCYLSYYNFCSGWVFYWSGYCYGMFAEAPYPPQFGTVFDLADCPEDCRNLDMTWWGCKRYNSYGNVDVEIYCATDAGCPVGEPLAGIYGYNPDIGAPWQLFEWDGLELCQCDLGFGKFLVLITDYSFGASISPYSDINSYNIEAGCEEMWRCTGHSYVYSNAVNYCDVYGMPGPMWVSGYGYGCTNFPAVPPGCHDYLYPTGYFTEFLIDAYISCLGATATKERSWGEIKKLYK
ncbi:MAG: hypothetical protein KAU31_03275 [Spirochaetaceae bacterium]|nr:hypothetical protein [Spirochaetaceae bacterium]